MSTSTHQLQTAHIVEQFCARFGCQPEGIASAPGRVNLIGEHTDYNDGWVLPLAIDRSCHIAAAPNDSNEIVVYSKERDKEHRFSLCDLEPKANGNFSDYVRGVVAGFCSTGASVGGFNAFISSDVPLGSGLSSSAALEVATATVLEALTGRILPLLEKARLCQQAEHDFVGVPCGLMDQYASVFGRADQLILLDCQANQSEYVAFDVDAVELLVINTNVRHSLADSEYALRRKTCESAAAKLGTNNLRSVSLTDLDEDKLTLTELKRARHVLTENDRTRQAVESVRQRNWNGVGEQMYLSHASLRDDYEVSCLELDVVVEICRDIGVEGGVFGARMTGGGFGGCAIALIGTSKAGQIRDRIDRDYLTRTQAHPTMFTVRPGQGARRLDPVCT
ncbi:MAG: galactokinase [Limisphaerales bacterium]